MPRACRRAPSSRRRTRRAARGRPGPPRPGSRRPRRSAGCRRGAKPLPQDPAAWPRGQQAVVVEAEQRLLEQLASARSSSGREEIAERHQILHGDLLGQHESVGARDRDFARLEGRDHGRRERRALAHQDQDVAGPDRAVLGRRASRRARASREWSAAMRVASRTAGEVARRLGQRRPGLAGSTCSAFSVGQISISPACPARCATCRIGVAGGGQPGVRARSRTSGPPPPAAARRRGTTGSAARAATAGRARLALLRRTPRPSSANMVGRRHPGSCRSTASRRRRRTACAPRRARRAGEELLGQRADHVPLLGARVLRLVDQDVVEAAVELVEHPLDRRREREQAGGLPTRSSKSSAALRALASP